LDQSSFHFASNNKKESSHEAEVASVGVLNEEDFAEMNRVFEEELIQVENQMDYENKLADEVRN